MTQERKESDSYEILVDIDETRNAISQDLQELSAKLSPEHLKAEAKEALLEVKDAAKEKVMEMKDAAIDTVTNSLGDVRERVGQMGSATWSFARENAVPLTLIGIGAGWLIASLSSERVPLDADGGKRPGPMREKVARAGTKVSETAARASAKVSETAARASSRAQELYERAGDAISESATRGRNLAERELQYVRERSRDLATENPLALGAAAIALGVGVGLALPLSAKEGQLFGASRDRLLQETMDAVQAVGEVAKDAVAKVNI